MRTASLLCVAALLVPGVVHADEPAATSEPGPEPAAFATDGPPPVETAPAPGAPLPPWTGAATIGVVSLPRVLSLEALVLKRRESDPRFFHFGFGAGIEYLPKGLISFGPKTDFSWLQFGVDGRFHPWRWAFAGARLGWQFSRTDSEKFGSEVDYIATSFFFAPKIGILHTFSNHITIGGDLGVTIPIGSSTKRESDGTEDSSARKAATTFGGFVMPFVSLFRIGYTL